MLLIFLPILFAVIFVFAPISTTTGLSNLPKEDYPAVWCDDIESGANAKVKARGFPYKNALVLEPNGCTSGFTHYHTEKIYEDAAAGVGAGILLAVPLFIFLRKKV